MTCPFCNKEMRLGYIDQQRITFGLQWYPAIPRGTGFTAQSREAVKLSSAKKSGTVKAYRCEECKKILIDEAELEV